jgi:hypothetical protein
MRDFSPFYPPRQSFRGSQGLAMEHLERFCFQGYSENAIGRQHGYSLPGGLLISLFYGFIEYYVF